jgi:hypothetical protein
MGCGALSGIFFRRGYRTLNLHCENVRTALPRLLSACVRRWTIHLRGDRHRATELNPVDAEVVPMAPPPSSGKSK